MGNFLLPGGVMIKTCKRVLLGGVSKNEHIQFFDSQICSKLSNLCNHSGIYRFKKNPRKILEW